MAAASCGPKGQLALLVDEVSQQQFLVDTGSSSHTSLTSPGLDCACVRLTAHL